MTDSGHTDLHSSHYQKRFHMVHMVLIHGFKLNCLIWFSLICIYLIIFIFRMRINLVNANCGVLDTSVVTTTCLDICSSETPACRNARSVQGLNTLWQTGIIATQCVPWHHVHLGTKSEASAKEVSYASTRAASQPTRMPYAPRASETVSVELLFFPWISSGSSASTELSWRCEVTGTGQKGGKGGPCTGMHDPQKWTEKGKIETWKYTSFMSECIEPILLPNACQNVLLC